MKRDLGGARGEGMDQVERAGRQRLRPVLRVRHLGERCRRSQAGERLGQGEERHDGARLVAELVGERFAGITGGWELHDNYTIAESLTSATSDDDLIAGTQDCPRLGPRSSWRRSTLRILTRCWRRRRSSFVPCSEG